jgi:hypothetical protein
MYNNYYPSQATYHAPVQQISGLKGRPVASAQEAQAATIDFDGSIFFFPDLANQRIYTKQINLDGTLSFFVYERKEQPVGREDNYITREEFEQAIAALRADSVQVKAPQPAAANFEMKF